MKTLVFSLIGVANVFAAFAVDGWLEWVGDPKGGNWSETANWKVLGTGSLTVEQLLTKSTGYDLSALTDGARPGRECGQACLRRRAGDRAVSCRVRR